MNNGKAVATDELHTAGKPARIILTTDRNRLAPIWDDVSYVTATIVDENGILVPNASDLVSFKLDGAGVIAAVDSADNASHEPFQATERRAYQGRCFALIKARASSGKITLSATAPGLSGTFITIKLIAPSR
jgi:beta-galactosidase